MLASDLHCHLDGSLRGETLVELSRECGALPHDASADDFLKSLRFETGMSLSSCLARFDATIRVLQTAPVLERAARELVCDCYADGVRHVEVRACPALHTRRGLSLGAVVEAILSGLEAGAAVSANGGGDGMSARLVIAVLEGMGADEATSLVNLAIRYSDRGVAGVDLAGNEALFKPAVYARAFAKARYAGLGVTVHAGEGHGSSHVVAAVTELGADRVGHGVSAASDPEAMALLRDRDVTVEVCLSSNLHTGAVSRLEDHPLAALGAAGVPVALATDNTFFSDTALGKEYRLASELAGASRELLRECVLQSADAAFLPEEDRAGLRDRYERAMDEVVQ